MGRLLRVVLLTAMCAVGGVWAQTTHIWNGGGNLVTGLADGSVVEIRAGASGTLNVPADAEISIISNGAVTNTGTITLNIGANAQVVWTADLTLNSTSNTITLSGAGNLSVEGGQIRNLFVSTSGAHAIFNNNATSITVSGGGISASGDAAAAINNRANGIITVSDNAVITSQNTWPTSGTIDNAAGGTVNVQGGTVRNTAASANANAIYNQGAGIIAVSGGEVSAVLGRAIRRAAGTVNITGGLIIAQNTVAVGANGVVNAFDTHEGGVIIGYTPGARQIDGTDGLVSLPTSANKRWGVNNGIPGIFYGENHNLFSVTVGVNIGDLFSWNSTAPNLGSNTTATVTISRGAAGTLNVPEGAEISIISNDAVDNTSAITLNIGANASVVWTADLTLNSSASTMTVNGTGNLSIEGGQVRNISSGVAINSNLSDAGTIVVSGGEVSANTGIAIANSWSGTVTISGNATITSASDMEGRGTIFVRGDGPINIQGGTVRNTAEGVNADAISNINISTGIITVSGGVVSAVTGRAINNSGTVTVSGGEISVLGTGNAIHNQTAGGTIIAKNGTISVPVGGTEIHNQNAAGVIIRYNVDDPKVSGTTDGLTVTGTGATAMWRLNSSAQGGILYRTDRFFVVPDVIVNKAELAIPTLAELTYNGTAQSPSLSVPNSAYSITSGGTQTNAGNYQAIVGIADTDNYSSWVGGGTAPIELPWEIKPAALTIETATHTRAYDATTDAENVTITLSGFFGDDENYVEVENVTAEYTNENAGTTTINISVVTLQGTAASNYIVSPKTDVEVAGITPLGITITGVSATNRTYNGEITVALTDGTLSETIGSDVVNFILGNGTMTNKNVGDNKAVTTNITLGNANYVLSAQPTDVTVNITPLQLTIANPQVATTRAYNGGVNATATVGALENRVGGDDVIVSIVSTTYNSKNVLEANEITVVYEISGADAGNYVAPENFTIAGTISKAEIQTAGITVTAPIRNKSHAAVARAITYGYTNLDFTDLQWNPNDNPFAGEEIYTATATLTVNSPNHKWATSPAVSFNAKTESADNVDFVRVSDDIVTISYTFPETLNKSIEKIELFYAPRLSYIYGDTPDLSGLKIRIIYEDLGSNDENEYVDFADFGDFGITTTICGVDKLLHSEHNGHNIQIIATGVTPISAGVLQVAKAILTPAINVAAVTGRTYDGSTNIAGTAAITLTGAINGDEPEATATFAFANKNAGANKVVTASGIALSGEWGDNYALSTTTLQTASTATISPLQLTIAAPNVTATRAYNGGVNATVTAGALANKVGDDDVAVSITSATYNAATVAGANLITVVYEISGADAGNYLAPVNFTTAGTITKANPSPADTPTTANATSDQTLANIALPAGWTWKEALTTPVGEVGPRQHTVVYTPQDQDNFNTLEATVTVTVAQGPTSIRERQTNNARYGILLENAIVSDMARISMITPEPAQINLRIIDALGNIVFTETAAHPYGRVLNPPLHSSAIIWNLTNQSGRFVANGTYLIIVEATGISGRKYAYSTRIGVNR